MFKDILGEAYPIIEKVAPVIATAIVSPLAGSATLAAINLIASAFGISPEKMDQLSDAIIKDPKAEMTLASLESNFSAWFKAHNFPIKLPSSIEINIKLAWDSKSH